MKKLLFIMCALWCCQSMLATEYPFGKGTLVVKTVARNAVRIQYIENKAAESLPEWLYVKNEEVKSNDISVNVDAAKQLVEVKDKSGKVVFTATEHQLKAATVAGLQTYEARLTFASPEGECLYGLGQFQDGYTNIRGLSRRLTQVNTQISIPMMLSSRGYGILWNNYGLTDFNPMDAQVALTKGGEAGNVEVVNVTPTEGGKQEVRRSNQFTATINVAEEGDYSLLLDVGQQMARRHNLVIDGKTVLELQNMWLPPTASTIVHLTAGTHSLTAELSNGDKPVVYYGKVKNETVFRSPVAQAVDYTVFVGNADEVIAAYRQLTGEAPLMAQWALGYIHCRERFHSQEEILTTAKRFRSEGLPADVMVQDWQYWGKYGWNAMRFDEANYPDPKQLTDELHAMNMRLMVSVWSKIDKNSDIGKQMQREGYYIPGTDWIDFFNPAAANAYWKNFSKRLVPLGIDAWWQDATEPENDDLVGRRVVDGKYPGELFRNVYPLLVNKTVYEGLRQDAPEKRAMILTRCAFPGIQRYGSAMWSGDVGNDWETFRRQISAGLGMQAAGIPWWTYDAGGFFRPGNQYQDKTYIDRMLRWIETSVYLPLMRVHGYMSNTEPWNYGSEAQGIISDCLKERYRLLPYIYSHAAAVSFEGSTLMRPLVFDFANDAEALAQQHEYMFGKTLLVSPVTEPDVQSWKTYLPQNQAGWFDFRTGKHYEGGQTVETSVNRTNIPVFVKGGSIMPIGADKQYAAEKADAPMELHIYPGADATFTLYEDDGKSYDYEQGKCSRIAFMWNDATQSLIIDKRKGAFDGMPVTRTFIVVKEGKKQEVTYKGKKVNVKL